MLNHPKRLLLASLLALALTGNAGAQSEIALSNLSVMPLASIVMGTAITASGAVALPAALSAAGAVLVIKAVDVTARGTVYVLERASDGAAVSVEILAAGAVGASAVVGATATVSVIGAGTILSVGAEVLAFIPNAVGRALLYNERVTQ